MCELKRHRMGNGCGCRLQPRSPTTFTARTEDNFLPFSHPPHFCCLYLQWRVSFSRVSRSATPPEAMSRAVSAYRQSLTSSPYFPPPLFPPSISSAVGVPFVRTVTAMSDGAMKPQERELTFCAVKTLGAWMLLETQQQVSSEVITEYFLQGSGICKSPYQ